jgi:hypothetical protein
MAAAEAPNDAARLKPRTDRLRLDVADAGRAEFVLTDPDI